MAKLTMGMTPPAALRLPSLVASGRGGSKQMFTRPNKLSMAPYPSILRPQAIGGSIPPSLDQRGLPI
ncbi:hypothetical protein SAY87_006429 [Trapa incisa]|uniref:Uncharacterized protein n=1 Tax=Trapa incisa TaxID=236973 RepID=A0AAN7PY96_9MYRT|nr:hypothetical protein SAY87_006429 [Trapa incisa]